MIDPDAIARPRGRQQQPQPQGQRAPGDDDPVRNSVFAHGIGIREVNANRRMTPAASSLIEVSRYVYRELITDDFNIQKSIVPEYLDYYATALLWFRITKLKCLAHDVLTQEEERLLSIITGCSLYVPEPFMLQLLMFGRIQTLTGAHLCSEFPPLPTEVVQGFGGYYGPISADTHNLYEEIPCLGVTSESVRHSISNDPPGRYHSSLERPADNIIPNENLLGFKPLGARCEEAKNFAFFAGITSEEFPVSLPNTGINLDFIRSISGILSRTKTFKTTRLDITTMAESGSITQAIMQKPIPATETTQKRGEIYSFANFGGQDLASAYGLGLVYTPNLFKEGLTPGLIAEWCCINTPPVEYINNRNDRRDTIPPGYREEVFTSSTQSGQQYRQHMVRMMLTTKR
ncbi:uncharacterized protein LOC112468878 isoform X2 [Temnothorax curvispinosus]|uniref:Uncharacterized protein LOC112468878 isoform X2 n=1 Tax=Temnothorax curvispinosus TaxID=300111 RepID=A0A6J1RN68_9HYME|nr:uncharacterized protein LOC112468878 isoform X2 [Temnothorax curvispinosus]